MSLPLADTTSSRRRWILIVKSIVIFALVLRDRADATVLERKLLGRFQDRYGPNRVGPFGLLQPLADVVKLLCKEQFKPGNAVPLLMALAPAIVDLHRRRALAIIPFGDVDRTGVGLYGIDVTIGILYAFAFGSLAFYGLLLGGWASGSKYSFLGAMRSAAQLITYEVSLGLALLGVVMMAGSLSLSTSSRRRTQIWYVVPQFVGFLIFMVAGFAETNRAPFDLPEADAELVAGYNTEFGGMRFGSFFMAEYINMFVISGIAVDLVPRRLARARARLARPDLDAREDLRLIFVFFIWVRATLPRCRYDQLMSFGWKVLLPLATLNLLVTASW